MKTNLLLIALCLLSFSAAAQKDPLPDLVITKMDFPQWDTVSGPVLNSYISITIKNSGKAASAPTTVKLFDYDPPQKNNEPLDEQEVDPYFETIDNVPALQPGQEITIVVVVKDYWLFDPNIDVEAVLDPENKVPEKKEDNNTERFFMNG